IEVISISTDESTASKNFHDIIVDDHHDVEIVADYEHPFVHSTVHSNPVQDLQLEKQITERFRFPMTFGKSAKFEHEQQITLHFEDQIFLNATLRAESSGKGVRFAICSWKTCMAKLGLHEGWTYRLRYNKDEGILGFYIA
ncbi:hypothetical protein M8C21_018877, partial [Ambrosia artemisiifolia]